MKIGFIGLGAMGRHMAASLQRAGHELAVYDLRAKQGALEPVQRLVFSSPISIAEFSPDGKRLFVLTADQTVFTLNMSAVAAAVNQ